MSIRFLKLSLASPESIRSWTERILPNGKRVGKILKGDLIDYKNGLPIRDGLSCERIFGPMVSFTCTCGRFKCIETRGIHIVHDTLRSSRPITTDVSRPDNGTRVKQWNELSSPLNNSSNSPKLERKTKVHNIVSQNTISKPIQKLVTNQKPNQKIKSSEPLEYSILQPIVSRQKKMIRFLADFYYDYESIYHFNKNEIVPSFVSIFEEPNKSTFPAGPLIRKHSLKAQTVWYYSKKQIFECFKKTPFNASFKEGTHNFFSPTKNVSSRDYFKRGFNKKNLRFKTHYFEIQNLLKPLYKEILQIYTGFWFDLKIHYNTFVYEKHIFLWVPNRKWKILKVSHNLKSPAEKIHPYFFSKFKLQGLYQKSQKLPNITRGSERVRGLTGALKGDFLKNIINFQKGKCLTKTFIYWSEISQRIKLAYVFQFFMTLNFEKTKTKNRYGKADSFESEINNDQSIRRLDFAQKITINHEAGFFRFKKNIINTTNQKFGLEIGLFQKKNVFKPSATSIPMSKWHYPYLFLKETNMWLPLSFHSRNFLILYIVQKKKHVQSYGVEANQNIPNEISLLIQKSILFNNQNYEKTANISFGSLNISSFALKQGLSNPFQKVLKKKNRNSQPTISRTFKYDKKLFKPISIFDSFKNQGSLARPSLSRRSFSREKKVLVTLDQQSSSNLADSLSHSDKKKRVSSLNPSGYQPIQKEETFSSKDKIDKVSRRGLPLNLAASSYGEDISKPYVASNTKQNLRVYKFKNFPPEEIRYCPYCEVELLPNSIRRYRLGYIEFISPVTHIWYTANSIPLLLNLSKTMIEGIASCHEALSSGFPPVYKWSYNGESPTSWTFQMQPLKLPIHLVPKIFPSNSYTLKKFNFTEIILGSNSMVYQNFKQGFFWQDSYTMWTPSFQIVYGELTWENNFTIYENRIKNPLLQNENINHKEKLRKQKSNRWLDSNNLLDNTFENFNLNRNSFSFRIPRIFSNRFFDPHHLRKSQTNETSVFKNNVFKTIKPIAPCGGPFKGQNSRINKKNINQKTLEKFSMATPVILLKDLLVPKKTKWANLLGRTQVIKPGIDFPDLSFWKDTFYKFKCLWMFEYYCGKSLSRNNWFRPFSKKVLPIVLNGFNKQGNLNHFDRKQPLRLSSLESEPLTSFIIKSKSEPEHSLSTILNDKHLYDIVFNKKKIAKQFFVISLLKYNHFGYFSSINKRSLLYGFSMFNFPIKSFFDNKKISCFIPYQKKPLSRRLEININNRQANSLFLMLLEKQISSLDTKRDNRLAIEKCLPLIKRELATHFNVSNETMREFSFFNQIPKKVNSHYDLYTATEYEKKREWLKLEGFFEDPSSDQKLPDNSQVESKNDNPHHILSAAQEKDSSNQKHIRSWNEKEKKKENDSEPLDNLSLPLVLPFLGKNPDNIEFQSNYSNHEHFQIDPLKFIIHLFTTKHIWGYDSYDENVSKNSHQFETHQKTKGRLFKASFRGSETFLNDLIPNMFEIQKQKYHYRWNPLAITYNNPLTYLSNQYRSSVLNTNQNIYKKKNSIKNLNVLKKFVWNFSLFSIDQHNQNNFLWPSLNVFFINLDNLFSKTYPFLPVSSQNFLYNDVLKSFWNGLKKRDIKNYTNLQNENDSLPLQEGYPKKAIPESAAGYKREPRSSVIKDGRVNMKLWSNNSNFTKNHRKNYQNSFRKLGRNQYYFKLEQMTRLKNAFLKNLFYRNKFQKTSIFHSNFYTNKIILNTNLLNNVNPAFIIGKKTCFLFGFHLNISGCSFCKPYLSKLQYSPFFNKEIANGLIFSSKMKYDFYNFTRSIKIAKCFILSQENLKKSLWPLKLKTNYHDKKGQARKLDINNFDQALYNNGQAPPVVSLQDFFDSIDCPKKTRGTKQWGGRWWEISRPTFYSKNSFQNDSLNHQTPLVINQKTEPKWPYENFFKNLQHTWFFSFKAALKSEDGYKEELPRLENKASKKNRALEISQKNITFFPYHKWPILNSEKQKSSFLFWTFNLEWEFKKKKSTSVGIPISIIYDLSISRSSSLIKNTPALETKQASPSPVYSHTRVRKTRPCINNNIKTQMLENEKPWFSNFKVFCTKKHLKKWTQNKNFPAIDFKGLPLKQNLVFYTRPINEKYWPKEPGRVLKPASGLQRYLKGGPISTNQSFENLWLNTYFENSNRTMNWNFFLHWSSQNSNKKIRPQIFYGMHFTSIPFYSHKKKRNHVLNIRNTVASMANYHKPYCFKRVQTQVYLIKRRNRLPLPSQDFLNTKMVRGNFKHEYFFKTWSLLNQGPAGKLINYQRHKKISSSTKRIKTKQKLNALALLGFNTNKIEFFGSLKIYAKRRFLKIWPYIDQNLKNKIPWKSDPFLFNCLKLNIKDTSNQKHHYIDLMNGRFPIIEIEKINSYFQMTDFQSKTKSKNNDSFFLFPYHLANSKKTNLNKNFLLCFSFCQNKQESLSRETIILSWKKLYAIKKTTLIKKKKQISFQTMPILSSQNLFETKKTKWTRQRSEKWWGIKSLSLNHNYDLNSIRLVKLVTEPQIIGHLNYTMKRHKSTICYTYAIETIQNKKQIPSSIIPSNLIKDCEFKSKHLNGIQSLSLKISCFSYFGYSPIISRPGLSLNLGNKFILQKKLAYQPKIIIQRIPKQIPLGSFKQTFFVWKINNAPGSIIKRPVFGQGLFHIKNTKTINDIQLKYDLKVRVVIPKTFKDYSYTPIFKWGERGHIFDKLTFFYKSNNYNNHKILPKLKNAKHNHKKNIEKSDPKFLFRTDNHLLSANKTFKNKKVLSYSDSLINLKQKAVTWKANTNYYACISQIASWGSDHGSWILFLKYIRANIYKGDQLLPAYFDKMNFQMMPRTGSIILQQLLSQLVLVPTALNQNLDSNFISDQAPYRHEYRGGIDHLSFSKKERWGSADGFAQSEAMEWSSKQESFSENDTSQNFSTNNTKNNFMNLPKFMNKNPQNLMVREVSNAYFHYNSSFFSGIHRISIPFDSHQRERGGVLNTQNMMASKTNTMKRNINNTNKYMLFAYKIKKPVAHKRFRQMYELHSCKPNNWYRLNNFFTFRSDPRGNGLSYHVEDLSITLASVFSNPLMTFKKASDVLKYPAPPYMEVERQTRQFLFKAYKQESNTINQTEYENRNDIMIGFPFKQSINKEKPHRVFEFQTSLESNHNNKTRWARPPRHQCRGGAGPFKKSKIFEMNTKRHMYSQNIIPHKKNNKTHDFTLDESVPSSIPLMGNDIRILKLIYSLIVSFQLEFLPNYKRVIGRPFKEKSHGALSNSWLSRFMRQPKIPWATPPRHQGRGSTWSFKQYNNRCQDNKKLFNSSFYPKISHAVSSKAIKKNPTYTISNRYYHLYFNQNNELLVPILNKLWSPKFFSISQPSTKKNFIISNTNTINFDQYYNPLLQNLRWLGSYSAKLKNISQLFSTFCFLKRNKRRNRVFNTEADKIWSTKTTFAGIAPAEATLVKNNKLFSLWLGSTHQFISSKGRDWDPNSKNNKLPTNRVFKSYSNQNDSEHFYFSNQKMKIYNIFISPVKASTSQFFNFGFPITPFDFLESTSRNYFPQERKGNKSPQNQKNIKLLPHKTTPLKTQKWFYTRPINHFKSDIKPYNKTVSNSYSGVLQSNHVYDIPNTAAFPLMAIKKNGGETTKNQSSDLKMSIYNSRSRKRQKNQFLNSHHQHGLKQQELKSILPINFETYKGQIQSEILFIKLKEIGNYNVLLKKKDTIFKTLILKMNSALDPLLSINQIANKDQIQLTKIPSLYKIIDTKTRFPLAINSQGKMLNLTQEKKRWNQNFIFEEKTPFSHVDHSFNFNNKQQNGNFKKQKLPKNLQAERFFLWSDQIMKFKQPKQELVNTLDFFRIWLFLDSVHCSYLHRFNHLKRPRLVTKHTINSKLITKKLALYPTHNNVKFHHNSSFPKILQFYKYRKHFLLKKIFKQRIQLSQCTLWKPLIFDQRLITRFKLTEQIQSQNIASLCQMVKDFRPIIRSFGFFKCKGETNNHFKKFPYWKKDSMFGQSKLASVIFNPYLTYTNGSEFLKDPFSAYTEAIKCLMLLFSQNNKSFRIWFGTYALLKRRINIFYDQNRHLDIRYEFKAFGPQIKHSSTYNHWKKSFKPQISNLMNNTFDSFKNQTRFRLLTVPQIFDLYGHRQVDGPLKNQNNLLSRMSKNKIPINILGPLFFSSSITPSRGSKMVKEKLAFPVLKDPGSLPREKKSFWGTDNVFSHNVKKYYDSNFNRKNFDPVIFNLYGHRQVDGPLKKFELNENLTPETSNHSLINVFDDEFQHDPIYHETDLNNRRPLSSETLFREENLKVSSSYKALLRKAKILEDYPIPDPSPIDTKLDFLKLLNGGLPRPIGWTLQTIKLSNKIALFGASYLSYDKINLYPCFYKNKNYINWTRSKNFITPSNKQVSKYIWDGNQNRFKNLIPSKSGLDNFSRIHQKMRVAPASKDVFSIRDQTKFKNETMTNITDGTSLSFFDKNKQRVNTNGTFEPQIKSDDFSKNQETSWTDQNLSFPAGPLKKKNRFKFLVGNSKSNKRNGIFNYGRNLRKLRLQYLRNFRRLRFIEYLKATYIKPEWMILSLLPVLPPDLRPVIANPRGYITGDINTHYQNVIYRSNNIEKLLDTFWIPRKFYSKKVFSNHQKATNLILSSKKSYFHWLPDLSVNKQKGPAEKLIKLKNTRESNFHENDPYVISKLFSKLSRFPLNFLYDHEIQTIKKPHPVLGGLQNLDGPPYHKTQFAYSVGNSLPKETWPVLNKEWNFSLQDICLSTTNKKPINHSFPARPFLNHLLFFNPIQFNDISKNNLGLNYYNEMVRNENPVFVNVKKAFLKNFQNTEAFPFYIPPSTQGTHDTFQHVEKCNANLIDWKLERFISPKFLKFTSLYFDLNMLSKQKSLIILNKEPWQQDSRKNNGHYLKSTNSFASNKFKVHSQNGGYNPNELPLSNTLYYKPLLKLYNHKSFFGSNLGIATGYNQIVENFKLQVLDHESSFDKHSEVFRKESSIPLLETKLIRTQALHDSKPLQEMQYSLQKAVDALIDNSQKLQSNVLLRKGRPLKSLSDNLKGKEGRFRQHLLGKRVDYSGRSVIVVGPDLKLYECGIPLIMALRLFQPFLILYLIYRFKIASLLATQLIQRKHPMVINLLKKFIETWPILLNRAPTLHRMNIQAFKIRLVQGKAILLHPLVCSSYNADFDGDQMGVHVPITQQARAESWKLLWSINNSMAIASRQPLFLPSQDMVIGNYYLTAPPIDNQLTSPAGATLILKKQWSFNSNIENKIQSYRSLNLDQEQEFSNETPTLTYALNTGPSYLSLSSKWPGGFPKRNHYFFSLEEAYQYYLNTVYRFHVNTPVWFRFCMLFETSEREKPIEITIDKHGNTIYTAKYYEKQLKRNRILGKNTFSFSTHLNSIITEPMYKPKSIKPQIVESSIQQVVNKKEVLQSSFQHRQFIKNKPLSLKQKSNLVFSNSSSNHIDESVLFKYPPTVSKEVMILPSLIICNKNLRPILLNQIIRSTFGRIEFYYEAFYASRFGFINNT